MDESMDGSYTPQPSFYGQPVGSVPDRAVPTPTLPDPASVYHSHAPPYAQTHPGYHQGNASAAAHDASFGSSIPESHAGAEDEDDDDGEDEEGDEEDREEEEEGDGASVTSSAMYDAAADPEGFGRRLDELAGMLEISEEEARALRQGPMIGSGYKVLPLPDFKNYINHYLTSTEWMYAPPAHADSLLRRQGAPEIYHPGEDLGELHPIRVLGRSWVGRDTGGEDPDVGLSEGLPRMQEEGRAVEGLIR